MNGDTNSTDLPTDAVAGMLPCYHADSHGNLGFCLCSTVGRDKEEQDVLVLSRKRNESIVINDDIVVLVVDIRGDRVRLGIEAPKSVTIHRREVYDAIKRSQESKEVRQGPARE